MRSKRISWAEGAQAAARLWTEDVAPSSSQWHSCDSNLNCRNAEPSFESETSRHSPILQNIVPPARSPGPTVTFRQVSLSMARCRALTRKFEGR